MARSTDRHERGRLAKRVAAYAERGGIRLDRPLVRALLLLALSVSCYTAFCLTQPMPMADMLVYRAEGAAVATGGDLYGFRVTEWGLPATYPPFAALLFVPTTWVSVFTLKVVFSTANLVLLGALAHLSCKLTGWPRTPRKRPTAVVLTVALGLWLEPVFQTMYFGQVNLLLAVAVMWDLSRPDGARGKGLVIGIAAGIKLTPAIFAVYLLLTGRVRPALTAAWGFAGSALVGAAFLPAATVDFWTRRLFQTDRIGEGWIVDNQSLQGLVARFLRTPEPGALWMATVLAVACFGLTAAVRAGQRGLESWGVVATAVTALLVTPISWTHHWVWCVPILFLSARHAPRWVTCATGLVFVSRSMWLIPHRGDLDLRIAWWLQPAAAPYPLLGLLILVAVFYRTQDRTWAARVPAPRTTADVRS